MTSFTTVLDIRAFVRLSEGGKDSSGKLIQTFRNEVHLHRAADSYWITKLSSRWRSHRSCWSRHHNRTGNERSQLLSSAPDNGSSKTYKDINASYRARSRLVDFPVPSRAIPRNRRREMCHIKHNGHLKLGERQLSWFHHKFFEQRCECTMSEKCSGRIWCMVSMNSRSYAKSSLKIANSEWKAVETSLELETPQKGQTRFRRHANQSINRTMASDDSLKSFDSAINQKTKELFYSCTRRLSNEFVWF